MSALLQKVIIGMVISLSLSAYATESPPSPQQAIEHIDRRIDNFKSDLTKYKQEVLEKQRKIESSKISEGQKKILKKEIISQKQHMLGLLKNIKKLQETKQAVQKSVEVADQYSKHVSELKSKAKASNIAPQVMNEREPLTGIQAIAKQLDIEFNQKGSSKNLLQSPSKTEVLISSGPKYHESVVLTAEELNAELKKHQGGMDRFEEKLNKGFTTEPQPKQSKPESKSSPAIVKDSIAKPKSSLSEHFTNFKNIISKSLAELTGARHVEVKPRQISQEKPAQKASEPTSRIKKMLSSKNAEPIKLSDKKSPKRNVVSERMHATRERITKMNEAVREFKFK